MAPPIGDVRSDLPPEVNQVLSDFQDLILEELPDELPPPRDTQQDIDLALESSLSNLPHYIMNPKEHAELKH